MAGDLLLGIDVGTSATKAVVCDAAGQVVAVASAEHPISRPRPGWSEQDPRDWWASSVRAARQAAEAAGPERIAGIGLSGQMHGSVFLGDDARGSGAEHAEPLRPALLWNDQRTAAQCETIERRAGGRAALVALVGNAALTGFTLPKLLWVREHDPETYRRTAAIVLPKDYVRLRLTGQLATDVGDAAGTLVFDVDQRAWSQRAITLFDLDPSLLPPALESGAVAGHLTPDAAAALGLRAGIPVVAGSGDNQAGAVGAGVVESGLVLATLGTSGVVYAHADRPRKDLADGVAGRVHTMCAADGTAARPGRWSVTGCMLSAGGSLQWVRDTLFPGVPYDTLMAEAGRVPPGSGGLVFLPYLTGERCPHPDPSARGGWIGLTSRHTRAHLVRAVVEGVTFGMAQVLDLIRGIGVTVDRARLGGGGARSPFWRQLQADVYGCPVALTNTEEGPAYGAALLAGVGAGLFASVEEACRTALRETEILEPRPAAAEQYREARAVYAALYGDLRERFAALGTVDAAG